MFGIDGLLYIPNYISQTQHDELMRAINAQSWLGTLSRRTQHYGYEYNYRARNIDPNMYLGPLPTWLTSIANQLVIDQLMPINADQAIINEYEAGQGIAAHIDCEPCFGDVVVSLPLGSTAMMDFTYKKQKVSVLLEPRSLVVLQDDARYVWKHGIAARKSDVINDRRVPRGRRVSATFRIVNV